MTRVEDHVVRRATLDHSSFQHHEDVQSNRDIQHGHRFVGHDDLGPRGQGAAIARQTFSGDTLTAARLPFSVALIPLPAALLTPDDPVCEVLTISSPDARMCHLFAEDRDAVLDPNPLIAPVALARGGYRVDVHAESFAHDVALLADKVTPDATVDDMLVSLAAGESATFMVRTAVELPRPSDLVSPRVLRCANTLSSGRVPTSLNTGRGAIRRLTGAIRRR